MERRVALAGRPGNRQRGDKAVRMWDAESGKCLEVSEGRGDVIGIARSIGSIAAGDDAETCRAINRGQEMVVEHAASGQPVAWFPATLKDITTSPSDNQWAGGIGNYLCIVRLEGTAAEASTARRDVAE